MASAISSADIDVQGQDEKFNDLAKVYIGPLDLKVRVHVCGFSHRRSPRVH